MEEYLKEIKRASAEIWNFFKTYVGTKNDDDERWEECVRVASALLERYKGNCAYNYARKYMDSVLNEIERVSKIEKNNL